MKVLISIILIFSISNCYSQSQIKYIDWEQTYGGISRDILSSIIPTSGGGYLLGGTTSSSNDGDVQSGNHGGWDNWIVQTNNVGTIEWEQTYGGSRDDVLSSIIPTSDGGIILGGNTKSNDGDVQSGNKGSDDFWVLKLNNTGIIEWEQTYGGSGDDSFSSIISTSGGGYLLGGTTSSSNDGDIQSMNHGGVDYWVVKINNEGTIEWEQTYGGSDGDILRTIIPTSDGGYLFGGTTWSNDGDIQSMNHGGEDYWVVKINNTGIIEWEQTYGGSDNDFLLSTILTSDGGYLLGGWTFSNDGDVQSGIHGGVDYWVVKINNVGTIEWEQTYGGSDTDYLSSIIPTSDGGYLFGGRTWSNDGDIQSMNHGGVDYWVVKINNVGTIEWEQTYGGSSYDLLSSIIPSSDGGYLLGGRTFSNAGDIQSGNNGDFDYWVVKLDIDKVLGIEQINDFIKIYPNPIENNRLNIDITNYDKLSLQLMDVKGLIFLSEELNNGSNQIDLKEISDGIYILRLMEKSEIVHQQRIIKK